MCTNTSLVCYLLNRHKFFIQSMQKLFKSVSKTSTKNTTNLDIENWTEIHVSSTF